MHHLPHVLSVWPLTIRMSDQSQSQQGSQRFNACWPELQEKTHAMVTRSNEDGEEAFTCVNVKRPRSSGNSKKSNSNRSTSDDEKIYSTA